MVRPNLILSNAKNDGIRDKEIETIIEFIKKRTFGNISYLNNFR
ncbi:MAG: hypothetical protein ACFFGP_11530 [Promethearchaeota archaeon]